MGAKKEHQCVAEPCSKCGQDHCLCSPCPERVQIRPQPVPTGTPTVLRDRGRVSIFAKIFKRGRRADTASVPSHAPGIRTYDSSFSAAEILRDPSRLATDRSLRCAECGKCPLLKKSDIVVGGPVAFSGSFREMAEWQQQIQKIADATVHMRAGRCTSCGRVYCFDCITAAGKTLPGGARGCLRCGARFDIVL